MKSFSKLALVLVLAAVIGSFGLQRSALAQNPPPTRIAVVNIVKAFGSLAEKSDEDRKIDTMVKKFQDDKKAKEDEITNLEQERKNYQEGSSDYNRVTDEILEKSMAYQTFNQFSEQKVMLEQRVRTADIYRKMNKAIQDIAQQNGIALVLVQDDIDLAGRTQQELLAKIALRKVVYADPSLDITQRLIDKMNADYQVQGGGK